MRKLLLTGIIGSFILAQSIIASQSTTFYGKVKTYQNYQDYRNNCKADEANRSFQEAINVFEVTCKYVERSWVQGKVEKCQLTAENQFAGTFSDKLENVSNAYNNQPSPNLRFDCPTFLLQEKVLQTGDTKIGCQDAQQFETLEDFCRELPRLEVDTRTIQSYSTCSCATEEPVYQSPAQSPDKEYEQPTQGSPWNQR